MSVLSELAGDPEAEEVAAHIAIAVVAIARAGEHGGFAPVVAAHHGGDAFAVVGVHPGAAVRGGANVVRVVAIGSPFVDVAVHVVDAKGVRGVAAHWCGVAVAVLGTVGVGVFTDLVLPFFIEREGEWPGGAGPGGVFTLGFADHAVGVPGLFRQPLGVRLDIVVVDTDRRLARPLFVAWLAGLTQTAGAFVAVLDHHAGFADVGVQFAGRDMKAADRERLFEGHGVLRAFIGLLAHFSFGRAHDETARRQYDHFRAVLAVFEYLAGFGVAGGMGAQAEQAADQDGERVKDDGFHRK